MRRLSWLTLALVLAPTQVHAHGALPGIEGFYTGLIHPFSEPAPALLMLSVGALVGSFSSERYVWLAGPFALAMLVGLVFGGGIAGIDGVMLAVTVGATLLVALAPGRLFLAAAFVVAAGGLLIGLISLPDPGPTRDRVITVLGSLVGANLFVLYVFSLAQVAFPERIDAKWVTLGLRIVSAWMCAIAALLLALRYVQIEETA